MVHDPVNHPSHYTSSPAACACGRGIECIQITESMTFCLGNVIKYVWRAGEKGDAVQDLRKAAWYLQREIARLVPETAEQDDAEQDDEPEFDPAYLYSDKDGETWEYLDGKWVQGDSRIDRLVSLNVNHGLNNLLPKYGPYTRIEEEEANE